MRIFIIILFLAMINMLSAQDTLHVQKKLNTQSLLEVKTKTDSTSFKTPKYKQGFFCTFEDQLNKKKVPIDFNLGNSKY